MMDTKEALKELEDLTVDYGNRNEEQIARLDEAIDMEMDALKAQSDGDTISRQAAIDDVCKMMYECFGADDEELDAIEVTLRELPAAQPEIIRCKDCKYMIDTGDDLMCDNAKGWVVATASDFGCVLAERRTDG